MRRKFLLRMMILSLLFAIGGGNLFAQTTVNDETSLKNALAIDGEVILGADIALVEHIEIPTGVIATLDLNGNTITNGSGKSEYVIYNQDGGTLTIKDSGTDGEISGVVYTGSESKTFINSGTFNAITNYALLNSSGTLTINGGTINGNASYPVYSYNADHKLVINDGVVVNGKAGCVNVYGDNGTVEINGGEFNFEGVEGKTYHIIYVSTNTSMTINGGTFRKIGEVDLNGEGGGGVCVNGGASLTVTGGTFDGAIKDIDNYAANTTIEVSGGTFSDMSAKNYITEGSTVTMAGKTYTKTEDGLLEINEIKTKEDLIAFAEAVNDGNNYQGKLVSLTADITLTGEWAPIGDGSRSSATYTGNSFKGVFDGGGKTISGLTITSTAADDAAIGLFGVVDGGIVKNLKLTDVNINTSSKNAGAAVGLMVNNSTVDNVEVNGTLTAPDGVGGVVGRMIISGTISNCENNAAVNATIAAGGIVGKAYYSALNKTMNITDCVNNGAITGNYAAGGIAGLSAANISDCSNTAVIASNEAGGIVGEQIMYGTINNNENSGLIKNINNGGIAHGGIIGWLRYHESTTNYPLNGIINVTNNKNTANIEATGATGGSGGIVGHVYNQANITGNINEAEHIYGGVFAAGIAGGLQQENNNVDIENTTITVSGNVSLTSIENITVSGSCKDLFAYNNASGTFVVKDNSSNSPIASVDGVYYFSLENAFSQATEGQTITLLADATPALTSQRAITKASVIDLGGKTLTLTEDDLYFGTTTFQNGNIVVDPSVKASTAVFWMFSNQTLTLDNVKLTATGVTGTYLIGINGGTGSNVKLLNNTKIIIDNESQAGLTAVICDNGTGNSVTIENSVININKVEGRFYLGGANGTITVNNTDIDLNGVKEGFYLRAGQTLSIEGTSEVEITLNDTNGRYGINVTDLTATYTIAETATVDATVYEPAAAAQIGTTKFATLQEAINAVQNGQTIILLGEVTETIHINKSNVAFAIDGTISETEKAKLIGKIEINVGQNVTVKNVDFVWSDEVEHDFIGNVGSPTGKNYNTTLLVENCSFTGNSKDNVVAVRTIHPTSVNIKDCTATGTHSFLQNSGGQSVSIDGVALTNSKGGISVGSPNGNVTVKNCNLTTRTYGVRLDANNAQAPGATLENNIVSAYIPVSVRKAEASDYKLNFNGNNSSYTQSNVDGVWCAICKNEYEEGVALNEPTGNIKVTFNTDVLNQDGVYGAYEWPIQVVYSDGYTKTFESLSQAMSFGYSGESVGATKTIIVNKDITESMSELSGNIITNNPNGVTIKNTIVDEWIYCSENFTIGEGVTYDATGYASGLFIYANNAVINGNVITDCYYQRYANTKLTINEPGSMTVKMETFIVRYMDNDPNAGIYINGDSNDETIGLNASVIYFYQGMINAKDANIKVGTYWQTNETDGAGSANLVLDNSKMVVTVNEHNMKATGNSTVTLTSGSNINLAGGYQGVVVSMDETSSMTKGNGTPVFDAKIGNNYYTSLQDAFNAGGNITVLRDVNLTETVTIPADITVVLDLNGKTISMVYNTTVEANHTMISNSGNLTIKSDVKGGKLSYEYKGGDLGTSYSVNTVTSNPGSVLTVVSGTIENLTYDNATIAYAIDGLTNGTLGNVTVNIEGGVITSERQAVRIFANSTTNTGTLNIEGGELTGRVIVQNANTYANKAALNVIGGTFNANDYKTDVLYVGGSNSATIDIEASVSGGTFNGEITDTNVTGFISGGTFSSEVPAEFLAEGFKLEENADGTYYGVVPFVEKAYEISASGEIKTFADAITKAKEDGADIVTYTIYGAATLETGGSHGIVDFGGKAGYITIQGSNMRNAETDSFTITGGGVPDIKGVAFKDLTFYDEGTYSTTANEFMYQNFIDCTFENVTFEDGIRLSGNNVVENCTFNANTYNEYAIWLDEGEFTMTGSDVTAGDDAYGMIKSDVVDKITITYNTFQYLGKVNKEALNVKDATIVAEDNTFIDCAKGVVPTDKTNYTDDGENITDAIIAENNTIIIYVAQIDDVKYQTLAEAATAAQDGETIQLLWQEGQAPIAMAATFVGNKTVTITGTADVAWDDADPNTDNWFYVGRNGAGNGKVIFDDAHLTSKSNSQSYGFNVSQRKKESENTFNGTIEIKNSTIEVDYMLNRNIVTLDNSTLTVKNFIGVAGRIASETENNEDGTATLILTNGSKIITNNMNGAGIGFDGIGIMCIDKTSSLEANKPFIVEAKGTLNNNGGDITINGTLTVNGILNSSGNITGNITKADAATIILTGGTYTQDVNPWCHEYYDAINNGDDTWTVEQVTFVQTREFAYSGWYWFSTYINLEGENGLNTLKEQLGSNAATIKGQTAFTNYQSYNGNYFWTSGATSLVSISPSEMYMIKTINDDVEVELEGDFVDYETYEITLHNGWNWIGYPLNEAVNVKVALSNVTPDNGDQIKGKIQGQTSTYMSVLGGWFPEFDMLPGEGYMYKSNSTKSLIYNKGDREIQNSKASVESNHWMANEYKYSSNMTVIAMLSIDGEIVKDNYEIAAFANGECRGSARPYYVEALDAYVLFMTIHGDEVENLTFKYYDVNYGTEYELNNTMVYSTDAIVGSIEEPYMFNLGILNIEESSVEDINIYPNPTTTGNEINLQTVCDKVEVFNALGVKVAEYTNVDSIDALETAGIYVIRVTIDGNARNCRLVVK